MAQKHYKDVGMNGVFKLFCVVHGPCLNVVAYLKYTMYFLGKTYFKFDYSLIEKNFIHVELTVDSS